MPSLLLANAPDISVGTIPTWLVILAAVVVVAGFAWLLSR